MSTNRQANRPSSTRRYATSAYGASRRIAIGGFLSGYDTGVIGAAILFMQRIWVGSRTASSS